MAELDDLLGSGTEEAIYKAAYKSGYEAGSAEGSQEGWKVGLSTGVEVGTELGRYKGFALAAKEDLIQGKVKTGDSAKCIKLCDKIIKLVEDFNWDNVTSVHDATTQVRTQYNLLKAFLEIIEEEPAKVDSIPGQKYSF